MFIVFTNQISLAVCMPWRCQPEWYVAYQLAIKKSEFGKFSNVLDDFVRMMVSARLTGLVTGVHGGSRPMGRIAAWPPFFTGRCRSIHRIPASGLNSTSWCHSAFGRMLTALPSPVRLRVRPPIAVLCTNFIIKLRPEFLTFHWKKHLWSAFFHQLFIAIHTDKSQGNKVWPFTGVQYM